MNISHSYRRKATINGNLQLMLIICCKDLHDIKEKEMVMYGVDAVFQSISSTYSIHSSKGYLNTGGSGSIGKKKQP